MNVLIISSISNDALDQIRSVDLRLRVIDARGCYDQEIRETWPKMTINRYLDDSSKFKTPTLQERDRLLSKAEIILGGFPYPLDIRKRSPRLQWFHQTPAGASNLIRGDLWGSNVIVTTSRGLGNVRAIAEYVLAGFFHFTRGLHMAYRDRQRHLFDHRKYNCISLEGKTVCVVGAGGIGTEVAKLCVGVGMRAVGTKRSIQSSTKQQKLFSRLESPEKLCDLLSESDCVTICCQWTPDTDKLFNSDIFTAVKPGAILVNVARGEVIDEKALIHALSQGRLRGVALDVYVGEFDHEPDPLLWDDERVVITPHVSNQTENSQHRGVELFCENLRSYIEGSPLKNVVDWERGY